MSQFGAEKFTTRSREAIEAAQLSATTTGNSHTEPIHLLVALLRQEDGTARNLVTKAGVDASVVSREIDVRATLAKVTLGEADAAIVYRSDVRSAADKVTGIEIPAAQNTVLGYPLVELTSTPATAAFATYLKGAEGRKALQAAGFESP